MERVRKNFIIAFCICLMFVLPSAAEDVVQSSSSSPQASQNQSMPQFTTPSLSTLVTPQNVSFDMCTKTFAMNNDRLFYLTLAAVNANRFEIKEIQSKTGYILFSAVGKEFLASVITIDKYRSMLKITPANNNYFFAPGIVLNMYKYIEVNAGEYLQNIPKGG